MNVGIPIVVVAFNRPKPLERLLKSLLKADYPGKVELVISVDGGTVGREDGKTVRREDGKRGREEEVRRVAEEFVWPFGEKRVILHNHNLGLREHVLSCGDLSKDYDGIIVLEDDLYVSPAFYKYTLQAFEYYKDDPKIAGISLYSHAYNETAQFPFRPIEDGSDVFFFQYAPSWGQFWSRESWTSFRHWYKGHKKNLPENHPPNVMLWPESSWKKYFIAFLIEKDLYFVYPRISLTTNFADKGTHHRVSEDLFQVPLFTGNGMFRLEALQNSMAVYDVYCEIIADRLRKLVPRLADYSFEVDLYGMKSSADTEKMYFLSSRQCHFPVLKFGREMKPHEMNIIEGIDGDYFSLGKKEDFEERIYFLRLLKCQEKKELAYWYPIREYHFYKKRLLTTDDTSRLWMRPRFLVRKLLVMIGYVFRYFRK